ncbi:CLUMA_CG019290, isoform A [Clunio marinus]|uniref:CLUMA_CG019290, isoform A n=1 Tax=Clunio marinus TaxID=568069 RepID=A0A1J1J0R3_9DIPT|nr:CLUMA_CG019290, isoform A [Clunio marinus]
MLANDHKMKLRVAEKRPPSSSLSYGGAMNDDVRSPGSGSTPGPLSAQPPPGLGDPDPGKSTNLLFFVNQSIKPAICE